MPLGFVEIYIGVHRAQADGPCKFDHPGQPRRRWTEGRSLSFAPGWPVDRLVRLVMQATAALRTDTRKVFDFIGIPGSMQLESDRHGGCYSFDILNGSATAPFRDLPISPRRSPSEIVIESLDESAKIQRILIPSFRRDRQAELYRL